MAEGGISAGMDSFSDFLRDTPSLALTDLIESDTESTNSLSSQIEAVSFDHSSDNQEPEVIGVVLMGKTGAGKSYLGNHLLKQSWFQHSSSLSSCTSECQSGERLLHGHTKLRVIDTPGLFDTDVTVSENMNKILSLFECLHCVDIFLLVVRVDVRFGKEEKEALQWLKDHFGENLNDFAIIILNNHGYRPKDKEALIREAPEILKTIIADCDDRCVLVQYNASNVVGENKDVNAILAIIKTTVSRNNGRRYTHKMHGEAKMEYDEKVKRLEEQSKKKEKALEELLENMQKENDELQKYKQLAKEKEDLSSRMNLLLSLIPPEKLDEAKDIIKDNENVTGQFNERGEKQTTQNTSILGLACKVRGKISDNNEATIRNNWTFLIDNIKDHIPTLMECLFQKEVFEHEDMEKIEKKIKDEDNRAGAAMLLKTMMKSGPDAYRRFVEGLKETGFTAVVDKLQDAVNTLVKRSTAPVSDRSSIQHSPKLPNSPSTPEISELHQYDMKRSTAPVSDRSSTQHSSARDRTPIIPFDSQSSNGYTSDSSNDNGIHSPTRRDLSPNGTQSITLNLKSNAFHNQSLKNQLGINTIEISPESLIGILSRGAYQPKEQKYDYPLTYHSPAQSKNTKSPNTSLYQQRPTVKMFTPEKDLPKENTSLHLQTPTVTMVIPDKYDHPLTQCPPKQPNNTVSPNTSPYQQRPTVIMVTPEKDLPKEYSGPERIWTSSIGPLQGRNITELGEFGNHCKDAPLHGKNQVENDIPDNEDKPQDLNPLAEEFTPTPTEDESFSSCFQYSPTTSSASSSTTNQPYDEGEDLPLHHATIHCKDEIKFMAILEENREDILKDDDNGKTPLELAYYSKFIPINKIKMIVSKGFTEAKALFKICQTAPTALIEMMFDKRIHDRMNDADREAVINLCSLLLDGEDITCKTEHNKTLVYIACLYSNIESVKYLLDKGCSISVDYTEEPLLFTCCRSSIQPDLKIQLLKSRGADLSIMDGNSKTLLHEACENGTPDCVRYLIEAELDVNACTADENYSPLHYCLRTRIHQINKIKLLVATDALSSDTFSNELLNTACMYCDIYVTKYILDLCESRDLQFNVNYVNNQGETPIYFCCISKILPVRKIKLFESKGSRLDGTYPHGQTLLHAACEHGKLECLEYLLQSGLDVNCKDALGHSPLFYCYNSVEEPINKMKLLMEYGAKLHVEEENIRRAVLDRVDPK
ncbi:hypothetical protein SNE40_004853 [Patella caerulea]|uniref:Uncharacterized protein n=1 Tax=Patella caerulea TaxID=87958 RepID=A0AAN8K3U9_PATCE